MAVPVNAVTGVITGVIKGAHYGSTMGNEIFPVVGALIGGLVGPVVGAVVEPVLDVKEGVVAARRLLRYATVNSGLSVKSNALAELTNALSAIPENRISKDSVSGHTIVTLNQTDKPAVEATSDSIPMGRLQAITDQVGNRYDAQGNYRVDVDALIARTGQSGADGPKIAIKSRDLRAPASAIPELCRSETQASRTSIYIQSNVQDPQMAAMVGLQFIDQLDRAVNGSGRI